ncbi:hypothetical protein ACFVMC_33035 [Nocardia sp. NPDC127579]|uniref:hypothetical protein n=1 Tax=Nocardia sp. NPDC127579 TaxID=3345402 RepID=UPI0036360CB5
MSTAASRVHLPSGYLPVGKKFRAVCACGWLTTPRVTEERALDALLKDHGWTAPICVLCEKDHQGYVGRDWFALQREVEILDDPATGGTFLVCRDSPQSCRDRTDQRMLHLDRTVAESFGIDMPRPRLRVVESRLELG